MCIILGMRALSLFWVIAPYPPENKDGFAISFSLYEMRLRISAKKTGFLGSGDNGAITHFSDSADIGLTWN